MSHPSFNLILFTIDELLPNQTTELEAYDESEEEEIEEEHSSGDSDTSDDDL